MYNLISQYLSNMLIFRLRKNIKYRKRLLRIMVLTALAVWLSVGIFYRPVYRCNVVLSVISNPGSFSTSVNTARVFSAFLQEDTLTRLAAENLEMDQFDGDISVSIPTGTNVLHLSVQARQPELAYRLVNSLLEVYPEISPSVFGPLRVTILEAPKVPETPSNGITPAFRLGIAVAAALAAGCALPVLSLLRPTARHQGHFDTLIQEPLLGTVAHDSSARLRIGDGASLKFSEDCRKIAARLVQMHCRESCRSFALASVSEDEGKATLAVNLRLALAEQGFPELELAVLPPLALHPEAIGGVTAHDRTILVVRRNTSTIAQILDAIESIRAVGGNLCGCIFNDARPPITLLGLMGTAETGRKWL